MSITVQLGLEVKKKLQKLTSKKGIKVEQFIAELIQKHLEAEPTEEEELIAKIQQGISVEKWNKYYELKEKRVAQTLTEKEHQELINIYGQIEEANAERILNLVRLSKLTEKPVRDLMKDLGIKTGGNV